MASSLTLIVNPGSASRKYALYDGSTERAQLHFEWLNDKIICTLHRGDAARIVPTEATNLESAINHVVAVMHENDTIQHGETIERIGLRIVAPSSYFLADHIVDDDFTARLEAVKPRAPIHIAATLQELYALREQFAGVPVMGVSDSAFHASKPDYAWNYGISLEVADKFDIKRFGYHGISVAAAVDWLKREDKLPPKLIVCHLGSGASVTAVQNGQSLDNTMGYSPLEGLIMATRSGSIDPTAVQAIKDVCNFDDAAAEDYLNNRSGLLGLGGSADIRELLRREEAGDARARLALATYIFSIQKAVGQMAAALGGVDALVFTGAVGERSAPVRQRVAAQSHYLGLSLDDQSGYTPAQKVTLVSKADSPKKIYIVPAHEAAEIARRASF